MTNYGIYFSDESYYGTDFCWEKYVDFECSPYPPSKEQVIYILEEQINDIADFIPAKEILDFIKALKDGGTGDELYEHLCQNLEFVNSIKTKALKFSREICTKTLEIIFGKVIPYNTEPDCHLALFRDKVKFNLNVWLKRNDTFIEIFKSYFALFDKDLFAILFEDADAKALVEVDVKAKIEQLERNIEYHKNQISFDKKEIEIEKKRLEVFELSKEELEK